MSPEAMPARGVHYALRAFGCEPREAYARAAHVKYGVRVACGDESARKRLTLAEDIILRIEAKRGARRG